MIRKFFMSVMMLLASGVVCGQEEPVVGHKHGDWYCGAAVGFSQSLAENAVKTDFITHQIPSAAVMIGHNFSPVFGVRLMGGLNMQLSRCSEAAEKALPEIYGDGRYSFRCLTGSASGLLNLTNIFFGYSDERPLQWSLVFGGGVLRTLAFDDKLISWNEYPYYPVSNEERTFVSGHAGLQCAIRLNEPWDLAIELRGNATDNAYNGVANGNSFDFYIDLMVNFVYHYKNGKQGLRRFRAPKRGPYIDPVMRDHTSEYRETVRYGQEMYTLIPFYSGFAYLNDVSMKRLLVVAKFMKAHPEVRLNVVGHPDIRGEEDMELHRRLATKRAEIVVETLKEKFGVPESHLRMTVDDDVLQPYKTLREWVPAVNFIMEKAE